jgi:hypothetical protein
MAEATDWPNKLPREKNLELARKRREDVVDNSL